MLFQTTVGRKALVICGDDSCKEKTFYSLCSHGFQLAGLIHTSVLLFFLVQYSVWSMFFLSGPSTFKISKRNPKVPSRSPGVLSSKFQMFFVICMKALEIKVLWHNLSHEMVDTTCQVHYCYVTRMVT